MIYTTNPLIWWTKRFVHAYLSSEGSVLNPACLHDALWACHWFQLFISSIQQHDCCCAFFHFLFFFFPSFFFWRFNFFLFTSQLLPSLPVPPSSQSPSPSSPLPLWKGGAPPQYPTTLAHQVSVGLGHPLPLKPDKAAMETEQHICFIYARASVRGLPCVSSLVGGSVRGIFLS